MSIRNRFPITTSCPDCQALRDGEQLASDILKIAEAHGLEPDRMRRAIAAALARWTYTNASHDPLTDEAVRLAGNAAVRDVAVALAHYFGKQPGHVH